jgi:hypothetical protein
MKEIKRGVACLDVLEDVRDAELLLTLSVHVVGITDLKMKQVSKE